MTYRGKYSGIEDHFDTSGVFEISKFDISKFACSLFTWQVPAKVQAKVTN